MTTIIEARIGPEKTSELETETSSPQKRILFFFDGTTNSAANGRWSDATNIFRTNLALHYAGNQIVFYIPGVGTRRDWMSAVTARGMDEIVREAYVNLASNFLDSDEICIFGYSRGAAAALALVDIISRVGLLWPDDLEDLHVVWDYYLKRRGREALTEGEMTALWARHFEGKVRRPKISFLGLFDPVPGNDWDTLTRFSNVRLQQPMPLDDLVDVVVSILAIDDDRNPSFRPVLLRGAERSQPRAIEQIWMPGVHADIGGNSDRVFLSDVALLTMIERAKYYCPALIWDDGYINRVKDRLGRRVWIAISNERSDWKRKLLSKASRRVASDLGPSQLPADGEKLHTVFDCLDGKTIWIRSKWQQYEPQNVPRKRMQRFSSIDDKLFKDACERALTNSKPP
ncbi:DUF2235 domain-containing protein [Bradyrhizobium sp. AZCC 2230]|uniref:DUF2235 domain-containing protein n=1 Tax=Bradyrhizobium sp. AZCC 2230 TaxID=3117021 RepID=UPI002FF02220